MDIFCGMYSLGLVFGNSVNEVKGEMKKYFNGPVKQITRPVSQ
jgi:hypothetical protein